MTDPHYKRGTIRKDGKLYGRYPDGSLYRIYSSTDLPFLQLVDRAGETFLRILTCPASMFSAERFNGAFHGIAITIMSRTDCSDVFFVAVEL